MTDLSQVITVAELESHTRALLRKIAKKYDIPMRDLMSTVFSEKTNKKHKVVELEFIQHSGKDYLYDSKTKKLYDVDSPHHCVGQLTEDNEILITVFHKVDE